VTTLSQAQALGAAGFHVFPIAPGTKVPMHEGWQSEATRTPETWPDGANVGVFAEKFGDNQALVVVDVDRKNGKNGDEALFALELEGHELPPTFEQRTPTGGSHLVFVTDRPVAPSVGKIGAGLDIRSAGSYIVGPGSLLPEGPYTPANRIRPAAAPDWLIAKAGAPRARTEKSTTPNKADATRSAKRAADYLATAPTSIEGEAGDITAFRVAAKLKDLGVDRAAALGFMVSWNERCSPPWTIDDLETKVRNAYEYGKDAPGSSAPEAIFDKVEAPAGDEPERAHPFDELNKEFAFVIAGGGSHILWETTDADGVPTLEHLAEQAFHKRHASKFFQTGKTKQALTEAWMESPTRRSYDGLAFAPDGRCDPRFYNLWRGFAVEPATTSDHPAVKQWIEHAHDNVCGGDDDLFRWLVGFFSHLVRKPEDKPLVSLVFRGGKGTGKNALVERVGNLLGRHLLVTANRRYLTGNFNGHLERNLMLVLDEAFWSGDKQTEGIVKDLITGSHHVIEHKGKEPYRIRNLTRVVIIGNEDWIVPASSDERRFAVFNVGDGRKQDRDFFESMRLGMEAGGYAHLLRYLLDAEISDVNAAPATMGLAEQKEASLEPLEQWWLDCLTAGTIRGGDIEGWPAAVPKARITEAFRRYLKERNIQTRFATDIAFGRQLAKLAPSIDSKGKVPTTGGQVNGYRGLDLGKCRAEWEARMGYTKDWT
jgi:hypothetical protein